MVDREAIKAPVFDGPQAAAIVAYLQFKRDVSEFRPEEIEQALANYWLQRLGELSGK